MSSTTVIKTNARNLLVIMTVIIVVTLTFGWFWRLFVLNQIHEAIGVYGLKVAEANGMNVSGISGSWWIGYDILESMIQRDLGGIFSFGLGVAVASFPLAIMYGHVQTAIRRIKALEKVIEDDENHDVEMEP